MYDSESRSKVTRVWLMSCKIGKSYQIETFRFYWVWLCAVSGFYVCQGWAVPMMDVQGCHLRIASVKMIDPSRQRGRLKFTAPELSRLVLSLKSDILRWWRRRRAYWCLLKSYWRTGMRPVGTTWPRADGLNQCFCWTSAGDGWVFVRERKREKAILIIAE